MREIFIKYNPYTVKTVFEIDGKPVDKMSEFYEKQENVRLQEWIEPSGEWKGFFEELKQQLNSSEEICIIFHGTDLDFEDLKYAYNKYGSCFKHVNFKFIQGRNDVNRLKVLKNKFDELRKGPVQELKDEKIQEAFKKALSNEFEIVVVAPMSSGKSTLINAILGTDLLPAYNKATTATITRIANSNSSKEFLVTCKDKTGKTITKEEKATSQVIDNLNKLADKNKNIELIDIKGNIPNISSNKVNIVFVDTPGGNNSNDEEHKKIMKKAIRDENKGMILFVFNYTQLETEDCDKILRIVSQAMKNTKTGKQARDRFIFVCNKMDAQDVEEESYEDCLKSIRKHLKRYEIEEPNLFLTSANLCKIVRKEKNRKDLTESEEDFLDGNLKKFNRENRQLFQYSSISQEIKNKYLEKIKENETDKRSRIVAEINSGIPALEEAINQYISKYAQAIKIKTVHDVFMNRVEELDMKAKSEAKWSESAIEYEKMRLELEKKEDALEKDKKLQVFKQRIDAIHVDYSEIKKLKDNIYKGILRVSDEYPEKVSKSEVKGLANEYYLQILQLGEKSSKELELLLENCVYRQCKNIISEYETYITELDKSGLLNIGDYNFKKIEGFNQLTIEALENISDGYITEEVVGTVKREKSGFLNAIKRFFNNSDGWYNVNITKEFVELRVFFTENIMDLALDVGKEIGSEIERAKKNEETIKKFASDKLKDINQKVKDEIEKVKEATNDKKKLEQKVKENRENMEWIGKFVQEMSELLDV